MAQKGYIKNSLTKDLGAPEMANMFQGIFGASGIMSLYENLACVKVDNNTVRMSSGAYNLSGHLLGIAKGTTEDLTIDSGTSGQNRNDLVVAEFVRNGGGLGVDTLHFRVVKGTSTSGTAADPTLTQQDINAAGVTRQEALYRVKVTGTEITAVEKVAGNVSNLNLVLPISSGAGFHNSIFRGKYLGSAVTTEQYNAILAGTFEDLYIGDYWTIGGVNWRIACFNYYYNTGDTALTTNHAVIVPDTDLYNHVMNDTNITTGAYVGSKMYVSGLNSAKTTINNAFIGHVVSHKNYLHNAVTSGYASDGSWYDSTVELMTETNVYGTKHYGNATQGTNLANNVYADKSQFPLFALNPQSINTRSTYWLRDVSSSTTFANVNHGGFANYSFASNSYGVRPAFCIS